MDLILTRTMCEADGIFSELRSLKEMVAYTLEHAYDDGSGRGSFCAKLLAGTYTCKRGMHRLHGMTHDFETFEVTNVPGHVGILFHVGNFNKDSEGCILLGSAVAPYKGGHMITNSRKEFAEFMELQKGVSQFILEVRD